MKPFLIAAATFFVAVVIQSYQIYYDLPLWLSFVSLLVAVESFTFYNSFVASHLTNFAFRRRLFRRSLTALLIALIWGITWEGVQGYWVLANFILFALAYNFFWPFWVAYWDYDKSAKYNNYCHYLETAFVIIFRFLLFAGGSFVWFKVYLS